MNPHFILISLLAAAFTQALSAETRTWKSVDGVRSVQGEFVKRDANSVIIHSQNDKNLIIDFPDLHADDIKWLDANHPLTKPATPVAKPASATSGFFETLTFDDTRESTLAKLKASKIVEMTVAETFIGRSGLNGVFRSRQKVGALTTSLYFDWSDTGKLQELNLQTDPLPNSDYKTQLEPCWKAFIEQLTTLHGKPMVNGALPSMASLTDGMFAPSHVWNIKSGGSAMLGTAREGNKYQVVVRFSQKKPQMLEMN
ncbi:MAG TPA: hypothetical protein VF258_07355 [Luteolibacter sp.]